VTILTLVYILTSAAFIYLVPLEHVTSGEIFVAQAGEAMFGRAGGNVLSTVVIVAVFGSLAAVVMSAPRVYFAMARDGLFIPAAAALHPRFGTPARAILIQATLASVLVLFGSFDTIISYFIFVVVIFIGLTVAGLFLLRKRTPENSGISLTPTYPLTPVVFLLLTALILVLIGARHPREAILGVVVVLLGLPVYYFVLREKR
jgi:APA family basic amino acid/polyamine antiporter